MYVKKLNLTVHPTNIFLVYSKLSIFIIKINFKLFCDFKTLAKDCGFKIVAHMMPDLPNMGMERDIEGFKEYFENPLFRSDGLKIYPTLVIRGTGLYELWRTGAYKNYTPDELVELVAKILALVPPWTRVYRIQRDIPMPLVTSGVETGQLRELALKRMKELDMPCRDVRTREVGIKMIHTSLRPDQVELIRRDYTANGGWETFLAYEDPAQDILVGLLRLRKVSNIGFRPEVTTNATNLDNKFNKNMEMKRHIQREEVESKDESKMDDIIKDEDEMKKLAEDDFHIYGSVFDDFEARKLPSNANQQCSIVRELHVYGTAVPVHSKDPTKFQHQGYGMLLMEEAERIAREEHRSVKILVISGVGTRHYYRKMGYELDGPYMSKLLI